MPKQRPHGTGSIKVEGRANGKEVWIGAVRFGGRQHQRVLGPKRKAGTKDGMTRREAEKALRAFRVETEEGAAQAAAEAAREDLQAERLSAVGEAYCEDAVTLGGCRPQTVQDYRIYMRNHILPFFGDVPLREITTKQVEEFQRHQLNEKNLAASTVVGHRNLLHAIFKLGMRHGYVDGNPAASARPIRVKQPEKDIRFLEVEEVEALIRATPDTLLGKTDAAVYLTAALTGLRQGELAALRWKDVDWQAGKIRVRRSFTRGRLDRPKSRGSERAVPMADRVAAELERHFQRSAYQHEDDCVFCHPDTGNFLDSSALRTRFKQALKQAEVRQVRFHDLRHTFATRMAAAGVPLRTLQAYMGHSNVQTTMVYADYSPDATAGRDWVERAFSTSENASLTAAL